MAPVLSAHLGGEATIAAGIVLLLSVIVTLVWIWAIFR